ncbi:hypothetical protein RB653_009787 [Dictyostelium firmibasis]|uniref:RING-type domain-containing protein n=1 Tax=Dictyostelium firmibasis TaxID=79012 RepID=A0AAN7YKF1_9MYCE
MDNGNLRNIIENIRFGDQEEEIDIDRIRFILKHRPVPPISDYQLAEITEEVNITERNKTKIGDCTICLCDFPIDTEALKLPCKHYFHFDCLHSWLKTAAACPNCRYPLPTLDAEYESMVRILRDYELKNGTGTNSNNNEDDNDRRHYSNNSMFS